MTKLLLLSLALGLSSLSAVANYDVTAEKAAQNTPDGWTAVSLPNIPSTCTTVTVTLSESNTAAQNAEAIQTALNNVDATNGTMVVIPAGTYLCNPISIRKDKTILHLSAGTTLKLAPYGGNTTSPEAGYYPVRSKESSGTTTYSYDNFINNLKADGSSVILNDIIIEGEGTTSIIEGQGGPWWDAVEKKTLPISSRPALIRLGKGTRFLFRNFKTQNSPGVNLCLGQSGNANNMTVHDVTISNPSSVCDDPSHNTDGMPIWGPYVNIYDCNISTGDDNIVADSGTSYCHAWNLTFGSGHGASIGSYTVGVNHIIYEYITFNKTETGFRIKTSNDRSGNSYSGTSTNGAVSDIICRNSTMTGVLQPIVLTEVYDVDKENPSDIASSAVTATTPEFCNILFQNIESTGTAKNSSFKYGCPIYIYGRPESYIHDITFDNVSVEAQKGMFLAYCKDIHFINKCVISPATTSKSYNATWDGDITGGLVTLDATTTSSVKDDASPWYFLSKTYSISNSDKKKYAAGDSPYLKYSSDKLFTINIPDGKYIESITFKGYDNYGTAAGETDSYIASVNGTDYQATEYVFPKRTGSGSDGTVIVSHTINLQSTVSKALTFKVGGQQTCLSIVLQTTDTPTAINEVETSVSTNVNEGAYYNLAGQKVSPTTKGILIRNGKKFWNK